MKVTSGWRVRVQHYIDGVWHDRGRHHTKSDAKDEVYRDERCNPTDRYKIVRLYRRVRCVK